MKPVSMTVTYWGTRPRKDRSNALVIDTSELSKDTKKQLIEYEGTECLMTFSIGEVTEKPVVNETPPKTDFKLKDGKSQSQKQRDIYYIIWTLKKQLGEVVDDFDNFYKKMMGFNLGGLRSQVDELKNRLESYDV